MAATSNLNVSDSDLYYYRRRNQNRLYEIIASFFAEEAERRGITKKDIAEALHRDPSLISRWLNFPSNLTADSISDLLLILGAEMDYVVSRFSDRPKANEMHPLIAAILHPSPRVEYKQKQPTQRKRFQQLRGVESSGVSEARLEAV
jgi:transcriptional regulator with XRE-family HTH domain